MEPNKDNAQSAPVIPSGTERTVYGLASFQNQGQVPKVPVANNPVGEAPQAVQPSAPVGTTFAELAAKKGFQSPDDLAKAYANLESHNKVVEMSVADLLKTREQAQQQPIVPEPQVQQSQLPAQPTQDDAVKIVENIARKIVRPLEDKIVLQQLFMDKPDAKDFAGEMAKKVKENPSVSWEDAYKLAKFDKLQTTSVEQGKNEAYQAISQKQAVQAGSPKPTQRDTTDLKSLIKDRTVPFSEITRLMKERLQP